MSALPYGLMADLHLHPWSAFSATTPEGLNTRLAGLLSEIGRCAEEVSAAGGKRVYMAGDIFHVRGSVSPTVLNSTRDMLIGAAMKHDVEFVIMPGNHDLEGKESTRISSAVTALECSEVTITNNTLDHGFVRLVPWVESVEELKKQLEFYADGDADRHLTDLILHAPIDGVIKGLPSSGLDPVWLAGLGFKRVFSGHYHNHKRFDGDIYSIGALAHHTWSDVGSKAGFLLVHPDKVEWRKSHLPEFIDLSQLVDVEPEEIPFLVDGNYVRVKVTDSKTKVVEAARQELLEMGAKGVIVQAEPKPPVREDGVIAPTTASGISLEASIGEFCSSMKVADPAAVAAAALKVLASVDSE